MKRNLRKLILFLIAAAVCFGQRSYTVTRLNAPAYAIAGLIWISDDGKTGFGGGLQTNPFGVQCITYQDGVVTPIPTPGFPDCQPQAANVGAYVARLATTQQGDTVIATMVSYTNGKFNILTPPSGVNFGISQGVGVNKQGQIAVSLDCPAPVGSAPGTTLPCAYLISTDGTFTPLSDLGHASSALAINDNGDVAGWVIPLDSADATSSHIVIWPHTGDRIDLTSLTGQMPGVQVAINSKRQLVGYTYSTASPPIHSAFFYDGAGNISPILVPGAGSISPISINDNGEAVGTYFSQANDGLPHPFYYFNGVAVDLNTAVTNLPDGMILSSPSYISNSGEILVTGVYTKEPIGVVANGTAAVQLLLTPVSGSLQGDPTPSISAVTNGASFAPGTSSLTWITIRGANLSTTTRQWAPSDFSENSLPTRLDGVSVTVNGLPAYPSYISPTQINVLAPDDSATGPVQVQVVNSQGISKPFTANKSDPMPAFFATGSRYVAAAHANGAALDSSRPAAPGEVIQVFGTGFGAAAVPVSGGQVLATPAALASPVAVTIGGQPASVVYAGMVSSGLDQLNVTVPAGLADGDAPIMAAVGGLSTQTNLVVAIKN